MKGYVVNIEEETLANTDFRRVLYTAKHSQLVVMSLAPGQDIGEEVHELDQFIRVEAGSGEVVIDGVVSGLPADYAVIIPHGARHNVINTGSEDLKLYTIYSPPEHRDGVVRATKEEAERSDEHFDGTTSE